MFEDWLVDSGLLGTTCGEIYRNPDKLDELIPREYLDGVHMHHLISNYVKTFLRRVQNVVPSKGDQMRLLDSIHLHALLPLDLYWHFDMNQEDVWDEFYGIGDSD